MADEVLDGKDVSGPGVWEGVLQAGARGLKIGEDLLVRLKWTRGKRACLQIFHKRPKIGFEDDPPFELAREIEVLDSQIGRSQAVRISGE